MKQVQRSDSTWPRARVRTTGPGPKARTRRPQRSHCLAWPLAFWPVLVFRVFSWGAGILYVLKPCGPASVPLGVTFCLLGRASLPRASRMLVFCACCGLVGLVVPTRPKEAPGGPKGVPLKVPRRPQEARRRSPGGPQEAPRRTPGGPQEVSGRSPGGHQEVPRRFPGGPRSPRVAQGSPGRPREAQGSARPPGFSKEAREAQGSATTKS